MLSGLCGAEVFAKIGKASCVSVSLCLLQDAVLRDEDKMGFG